MPLTRLVDMIPNYCPIDGPYDDDTVTDVARSIAELVRYLNHASIGRTPWPWAATTYRVTSGLKSAVYGLDQLVGQLADVLDKQANDRTLYDDRRDRPGRETAASAAAELRALRPLIYEGLAPKLENVVAHTVHLGND